MSHSAIDRPEGAKPLYDTTLCLEFWVWRRGLGQDMLRELWFHLLHNRRPATAPRTDHLGWLRVRAVLCAASQIVFLSDVVHDTHPRSRRSHMHTPVLRTWHDTARPLSYTRFTSQRLVV